MYADDLILLSISVSDLQSLLSMCTRAFEDLDLSINLLKSHCLRVGPRFNAPCCMLSINGVSINWVNSTKFLGITLCSFQSYKCDWSSSKKNFYCGANAILGRLGTSAPISVILN